MTQTQLLTQLVIAVAAAFAGGLLARVLKLPVLIGYILGGVVVALLTPEIGPAGGGMAAVAELGVILLMFIIGMELSLPQLMGMGRTIIWIAVLQILLTIALGIAIGATFGYNLVNAVVLGFAIALSSTAVVLRSLEEHGQVNTRFGQVMLGILITQDLAVVVMLAMLPALGGSGGGKLSLVLIAFLRSIVVIGLAILVASKVIPLLLNTVAGVGSRELFALTVITISFAAAFGTYKMGLSIALGAFIAGVVVGESEYTHQVFADVAPMRDIFAAIFFVSIGAAFRPAFFARNPAIILFTLVAVVVGKFLIITALVMLFGQHRKVAFLSGVGLAQIGEFSFLIAQVGRTNAVIPAGMYELIMSVTLLSILITPLLIYTSPAMYAKIMSIRWLSRLRVESEEPVVEEGTTRKLRDHVIVLGYGNVGSLVGAGLHAHGIPYLVVDYGLEAVKRARARGIPAIYGDAANPLVIRRANPKYARAAVVALPDTFDNWRAVRYLQDRYPELPIIARAATELDIGRLYAEGAEEVVNPRYEAGLEILRHIFILMNVPAEEREMFVDRMRHWEPPHDSKAA